MSRRGGGRRSENRPEQMNQTPSFYRGAGGDGDGRGRDGRGRGGGRSGNSQTESFPPLGQQSRSQSQTQFPSLGQTSSSSNFPPLGQKPSQSQFPSLGQTSSSSNYPPLGQKLSQSQFPSRPVTVPAVSPSISPASTPASSSPAIPIREIEKFSLQPSTSTPAITQSTVNSPVTAPPASSKLVTLPKRPGYGTVGRKVNIRANHFLVQIADKDLHHYDVTITPEVVSKKVNRDVINALVRLYESHLAKRNPVYDGRKSLYTAGPLPFLSNEFVVKLVDPDIEASSTRKEREFKIAIKLVAKADSHHLNQFLLGKQRDAPHETIQVLDVVLREAHSNNYTTVGRSFFDNQKFGWGELGNGVQYWRGFYQSLRPTQMGLSLNIDVSARSFYESVLVTDFVRKYLAVAELGRPLTDRDRIMVSKALKGLKVELNRGDYKRKYKITGVSIKPTNLLMFTNDDGKQLSVAQYFREKYNIVLKYAFLPALQAGNAAKPVSLPMELCTIVKGQRYTKKLTEKQVTAMLKATCQRPTAREDSIKTIVKGNKYNSDEHVKEFGIEVKEGLTLVNARVLPAPRLRYHESGKETNVEPRVGQWNMINKKMVGGGTVHYWTCISFSSRMRQDMVDQFCKQLVGMCASKGMAFNPKPLIPINSAHSGKVEKALIDVHTQSTAELKRLGQMDKQLQLLIIILPDMTGSYGQIKRICETDLGIVSQCCKPNQAQKLNNQYLENVSLKINVKVGGRNSVLVDAINKRMPFVSDRPTIIFGADVTHPQPGESTSPSIAAVVASMDWPEVTKYRGLVSAQSHRVEIIEDLYKLTVDPKRGRLHGGMIRELLIEFYKATRVKPQRIIFYRDGVSEGQFSQVLLHEVDAIRKACVSIEDEYLPRITFVVVQKRHHTRFFTDDHTQQDKSGNILPGTVVDTQICHPTEFDFYLNSHAGIQGTSRPSHYHVLLDENSFSADDLQILTNNLCYTYARCTRSVSVVPPAYYAHLLAFRARYYIEGDFTDTDPGITSTAVAHVLPVVRDNVKAFMFYC